MYVTFLVHILSTYIKHRLYVKETEIIQLYDYKQWTEHCYIENTLFKLNVILCLNVNKSCIFDFVLSLRQPARIKSVNINVTLVYIFIKENL